MSASLPRTSYPTGAATSSSVDATIAQNYDVSERKIRIICLVRKQNKLLTDLEQTAKQIDKCREMVQRGEQSIAQFGLTIAEEANTFIAFDKKEALKCIEELNALIHSTNEEYVELDKVLGMTSAIYSATEASPYVKRKYSSTLDSEWCAELRALYKRELSKELRPISLIPFSFDHLESTNHSELKKLYLKYKTYIDEYASLPEEEVDLKDDLSIKIQIQSLNLQMMWSQKQFYLAFFG